MAKISATILTLNEEKNIEACLKTLEWCDEIIVVDSYSEDSTVEIAQEYADEVYQKEVEGENFSEPLRQFAVDKASGDWILKIDADERVPKKLSRKLESLSESNYDVIEVPRRNYFMGTPRESAWPDYVKAMYRPEAVDLSDQIHNFEDVKPGKSVHAISPDKNAAIEHFSYTDIEDRLERINRYTTIETKQNPGFSVFRLVLAPLREFFRNFIYAKGFKDGARGFILSFLDAFYPLIEELKRYERLKWGGRESYLQEYEEISEQIIEQYEG
ncbi:MAG: glycosyltransferase family 2 protein [Candidatus Nanohalobium sp.]